jgi:hypothetical protein
LTEKLRRIQGEDDDNGQNCNDGNDYQKLDEGEGGAVMSSAGNYSLSLSLSLDLLVETETHMFIISQEGKTIRNPESQIHWHFLQNKF